MSDLTHEELLECLDYDPGTGIFLRKKTTSINPRVEVGGEAGSIETNGYIGIGIGRTRYRAHRLAWFYVNGQWPESELDHANGVKTDNRIDNLREATRSQNMANGPRQKNNTSGTKGVHFDKTNRKWMAYMQVDGKFRNLGRFVKKEDAVAARVHAAKEAFGGFARAG